jgi:hypothetical protein
VTINSADILGLAKGVTKDWTKQRKAEERGRRSIASRAHIFAGRVNFTEVADDILPGAYAHASGGGSYSVSKRQLYYACREAFKERTGRELEYNYFAQTLLVQYLNRHPGLGWKITADPRGTLTIPNSSSDVRIPVGTLQIDNHLCEAVQTPGPFDDLNDFKVHVEWPSLAAGQRYQAVLYIEKEGFEPLLEEAGIAERFDLAIMSCKGQSVVAARRFVDQVCAEGGGIPLLVVHDFDKAGFEISQRLTTVSGWAKANDRVTYHFRNRIRVIDLGLRLAHVEEYGLQEEQCPFKGRFAGDSIATAEERTFLRSGRRVELNAFTSPQFIEWLEAGLRKHGLNKRLIPRDEILAAAYHRALAVSEVNRAIERTRATAIDSAKQADVPKELRRWLQEKLEESPQPWDKALYELVAEEARA